MPNIFKPNTNTYAKVSLLLAASLPLFGGLALAAWSRSPANTKVNVPLNQPVPFSHQHHAWELGIDCGYCHTGVEKSASAGVPPTETCMSCHSQIWTNSPLLEPVRQSYETGTPLKWNRVNKLPEFVYFNHSIHVARGVSCNQCHGPVQNMNITWKGNPFQMAWCLECHRAPEKYIYKDEANPKLTPREQVFNLYWKYQAGDKLSPREDSLIRGTEQYSADPAEQAKGRTLINTYGVKVQQLADCSVCHR